MQVAEGQTGLGEAGANAIGEGLFELAQRQWRQLFGTDLDQEIALAHAADAFLLCSIGKPSASRLS